MKKKILSLITLIAILMSMVSYTAAKDSFTVQNGTVNLKEKYLDIKIATPNFEGFPGSNELNRLLRNMVADSIGQIRTAAKSNNEFYDQLISSGETPYINPVSLDITYDYFKSGDILSLQVNTYMYLGGAHPTNWITAFTVNTKTGKVYTLKSMFKENSDYVTVLTNKIVSSIDKNADFYFDDYAKTIRDKNGDLKFYIDGDKLVIYFDLYDIAPYAAGINRFVFDAAELKDLLKTEVYNSIKSAKPLGSVRYNGSDLKSKSTVLLNSEGLLVPLRNIAEALGYKVDWNEKDGAIVAGGFIKDGINSYWTTGKEPVTLIPPLVVEGVTFVPIQYFREVLEENVTFENMNFTYISNKDTRNLSESVLRIFSKKGYENNFNNLIKQFENPRTEEEAVQLYAEAVKNRNGAVQYALLSDELRNEKYESFEEVAFVTGVSSPWVESYDIKNTGSNQYQINFHLKTSVPAPVADEIVSIAITQIGDYYRISKLITEN